MRDENLGSIAAYLENTRNFTRKLREIPRYAIGTLDEIGSYIGRKIDPKTERWIGYTLIYSYTPIPFLLLYDKPREFARELFDRIVDFSIELSHSYNLPDAISVLAVAGPLAVAFSTPFIVGQVLVHHADRRTGIKCIDKNKQI